MQNIYKQTMRKIINKQAENLYSRLKLEPGFELSQVVEALGGVLKNVPSDQLGSGVVAKISPMNDGQSFCIDCSEEETDEKSIRFSIAHELGHLFLHMANRDEDTGEMIIKGIYERRMGNGSINEWEADEFAAAFLMPQGEFLMSVEALDAVDDMEDEIRVLSDKFLVSYKSVITRGRSLDIW